VEDAADTDALIVDSACRLGNAVILGDSRLAAEDRVQEGMRMAPEEHRWPPRCLFLLSKKPDG
jgi:hypothetical protein